MITDGNEGITSTDKNVAQIIRNTNKKSILVVNKIDNNEKQYNINDFFELGFENILGISAYHNLKIDLLGDEIIDNIPKITNDVSSKYESKRCMAFTGTTHISITIGVPNFKS